MNKPNKSLDSKKLIILLIGTIVLLLFIFLYGFISGELLKFTWQMVSMVLVPSLIVIFMLIYVFRRYQSLKNGMPLEDERSRKIITMAAAKSFYVTMYWLLAISMFEDFWAEKLFNETYLDTSRTVGGAIMGMAIAFLVFWLYYNKKGEKLL